MNFSSLQKKKSLVINTKIIIKVNNKNYSLQKSSLPIDNILSITRLYFKKDNKKFGKYNAYTKIVLFDKKIIYSENIEEAIQKGLEFENLTMDQKNAALIPLMEFIRNNHTYLNRIQTILHIFDEKSRT